MVYIVNTKYGIKNLATGDNWENGAVIGPNSLPAAAFENLVKEGLIIENQQGLPLIANLAGMTDKILKALEGIGVKTTAELLAKTDEDLLTINGVGQTTVDRWRKVAAQ